MRRYNHHATDVYLCIEGIALAVLGPGDVGRGADATAHAESVRIQQQLFAHLADTVLPHEKIFIILVRQRVWKIGRLTHKPQYGGKEKVQPKVIYPSFNITNLQFKYNVILGIDFRTSW